MADYVSPEARRRIAGGLMAAQYDRATPEEGNVAQRHGLLPLATYDNGRTGLAFPGFVAEPLESWGRLLKNGYTSGDTQGVEDAFNVAGAAMLGGLAAPKPRNVVGSAGGSLAPDAAALDMSQAARMQRARDMGFNTEQVLYHGTGKTFDEFNPGTNGHGRARNVYLTDRPEIADIYANSPNYGLKGGGNPMIYPLYAKSEKPLSVSDKGPDGSFGWVSDNLAAALGVERPGPGKYSTLYDEARRQGYDQVQIKEMTDLGGHQTQYIPLRPENIRSVNAAFDPEKINSPNLLYANGGRPGATAGAALGAIPDAAALDMSHAARMQRAREMGFDTATNWFHGSKRNDLSEITPGTKEPGAWFTTEKKIAADYARGEDAAIYETYLKTKNPFVVQMDPASPDIFAPMHNGSRIDFDNNVDIVKHAFRNGYDGVHFPDGNFSEYGNTMVVARPNQIRSKDAAFNPAKADSANLLYANGGRPGATAGAALGGVDLQDPALAEILRKYGLDVPSRPASPQYRPGDA